MRILRSCRTNSISPIAPVKQRPPPKENVDQTFRPIEFNLDDPHSDIPALPIGNASSMEWSDIHILPTGTIIIEPVVMEELPQPLHRHPYRRPPSGRRRRQMRPPQLRGDSDSVNRANDGSDDDSTSDASSEGDASSDASSDNSSDDSSSSSESEPDDPAQDAEEAGGTLPSSLRQRPPHVDKSGKRTDIFVGIMPELDGIQLSQQGPCIDICDQCHQSLGDAGHAVGEHYRCLECVLQPILCTECHQSCHGNFSTHRYETFNPESASYSLMDDLREFAMDVDGCVCTHQYQHVRLLQVGACSGVVTMQFRYCNCVSLVACIRQAHFFPLTPSKPSWAASVGTMDLLVQVSYRGWLVYELRCCGDKHWHVIIA